MTAATPAREYEATLVSATRRPASRPGYDPMHKTGDTAVDAFAHTALIRQPAAPGSAGAEDEKKDLEGRAGIL